jgi:hypothetical protein
MANCPRREFKRRVLQNNGDFDKIALVLNIIVNECENRVHIISMLFFVGGEWDAKH